MIHRFHLTEDTDITGGPKHLLLTMVTKGQGDNPCCCVINFNGFQLAQLLQALHSSSIKLWGEEEGLQIINSNI